MELLFRVELLTTTTTTVFKATASSLMQLFHALSSQTFRTSHSLLLKRASISKTRRRGREQKMAIMDSNRKISTVPL
jgi:hypothetical protein